MFIFICNLCLLRSEPYFFLVHGEYFWPGLESRRHWTMFCSLRPSAEVTQFPPSPKHLQLHLCSDLQFQAYRCCCSSCHKRLPNFVWRRAVEKQTVSLTIWQSLWDTQAQIWDTTTGSRICSYFCGDCILPDKLSGTGDLLQPLFIPSSSPSASIAPSSKAPWSSQSSRIGSQRRPTIETFAPFWRI